MEFTVHEDMQCKLLNLTTRAEYLKIYTDDRRGDILSGNFWDTVCCGAYGFFATNGTKKHISMHPFDSNWGEFSEYIPNRTTNWGGVNECYDEERKENLLWRYLNHTNLSAVFTVQVRYYILEKVKSCVCHSVKSCVDYFLSLGSLMYTQPLSFFVFYIQMQFFDHPKVFSIPLGPQDKYNIANILRTTPMTNRTNLLFLSNSDYEHRVNITNRVISNFHGTLTNRYNDGVTNYYELLQTSKYILCPSGLGWDTYRTGEALVLGTIPILETYYRKDGMYSAYD